jgi:hypothetical protein
VLRVSVTVVTTVLVIFAAVLPVMDFLAGYTPPGTKSPGAMESTLLVTV